MILISKFFHEILYLSIEIKKAIIVTNLQTLSSQTAQHPFVEADLGSGPGGMFWFEPVKTERGSNCQTPRSCQPHNMNPWHEFWWWKWEIKTKMWNIPWEGGAASYFLHCKVPFIILIDCQTSEMFVAMISLYYCGHILFNKCQTSYSYL